MSEDKDVEIIYTRSQRGDIPAEHRPGFNQGTAKTKARKAQQKRQRAAADRELAELGLRSEKPRG